MKKLISILFLAFSLSSFAQIDTKSNYDVNGDGYVNISDVTSTVNRVIGNTVSDKQVVDAEILNTLLSSINTRLANIEKKLGIEEKVKIPNAYIGLMYIGDVYDNILLYIEEPGTNKLLNISTNTEEIEFEDRYNKETFNVLSWELEVEGYIIPVKYIYKAIDPSNLNYSGGLSNTTWRLTARSEAVEEWSDEDKKYLRIHNVVLLPKEFDGGAVEYGFGSYDMSLKTTLSNGYRIYHGTVSTPNVQFEVKLSIP